MILYFSATGNCAFAAKRIAERIGDEAVNLLEKFRANDHSALRSEKPWVIVSPVYVAEMPRLVRDWLKATPLTGSRDIFFVFTAASEMSCSGYFAKQLAEEKGMVYHGSASVRMPTNYPIFFTVKEDYECRKIVEDAIGTIDKTAEIIALNGVIPEKKPGRATLAATIPVNELYYKYFVKADDFYATDACISCGKCTKVCPYVNITLKDGKPVWGDKCTHCMACLSACPKEAIEYGTKTPGKRRYHFPKNLTVQETASLPQTKGDKKMKVVLAGAFGHLGLDILRELVARGYDVVANGRTPHEVPGCTGFTPFAADAQKPETLRGMCDGADLVISTVGLTKASAEVSCYDVDLQGNLNILAEAKRAGVKNFAYISVLKADGNPSVPMLDAKAKFEEELKKSGLNWVIFRPSGYFYDIAKVFMPMIEKGKVTLLGSGAVHCNVVDTPDFARFIVDHMCDNGKVYNVGGKETWSYEELARMFFAAAGKEPKISRAPAALFDVLAWVNRKKKNGKEAIIRFSKWTLTEEMVGDTVVGDASFAEYIKNCYKK